MGKAGGRLPRAEAGEGDQGVKPQDVRTLPRVKVAGGMGEPAQAGEGVREDCRRDVPAF